MSIFSRDLGVDLGTMYIRAAESGRGDHVLLEEPMIAAIVVEEQMLAEWGQAAADMYGRVPESIEVARPMRNGVIAEFEVTTLIIKALLSKLGGRLPFFHPRVMITVPEGITSVERRAVHEATLRAGSSDVALIQQPLAAALGVDLPIGTPSGNMLISLGGGTTQAAVLAMYGIVSSEAIRAGGMQLDEAIIAYVRKKYGLIIGPATAEQVKLKIGAAVPMPEEQSVEIQGQDQVNGLPRPVTLTTGEVVEAMSETLQMMVQTARRTLEKTPPELVSDIIDRGVALTGGGALLRGIDKLMTKELGVPAYLVDNPTTCVAQGAARALKMRALLRRNLPPV
ncbi:MAG: rod shape-determining protein [Chloroflexota bacterium]